MRSAFRIQAVSFLIAALTAFGFSFPARAASGHVNFAVYKAGWFVGGSGGEGTLTFHRRHYRITIGGISAGFVFGASKTYFRGTVSHIRRASDVAGVYGAVGGGGAVGVGARVIVLQNAKGAVLKLTGRQVGLQVNADLSGMTISLR